MVPPNGRPLIHLLSSFLFLVAGCLLCFAFSAAVSSIHVVLLGLYLSLKKKMFLHLLLVSFGMLIKCMCSVFHF